MEPQEHLSEMAGAFQRSVVLLTAHHNGIFAAIAAGKDTPWKIASVLCLDARAVETLLLALAAEDVLRLCDETRFQINPDLAPLLLPDSPASQFHILNHQFRTMQRWIQLDAVLKTGKPATDGAKRDDPAQMRDFICGMADISRQSSREVADNFDLSPFRRMLDLGGGPATAAITFAQRNPALHAVVFDLPGPIEIAREQIDRAGLSDRIGTAVGNFLDDPIGEGFDLVYISNIIHCFGPDEVNRIVKKACDALIPGGTIVIKDFLLDRSRTRPRFAAFFSINMLVATDAGRSYTMHETTEMLRGAGFDRFRTINVASASSLLIAVKQR